MMNNHAPYSSTPEVGIGVPMFGAVRRLAVATLVIILSFSARVPLVFCNSSFKLLLLDPRNSRSRNSRFLILPRRFRVQDPKRKSLRITMAAY